MGEEGTILTDPVAEPTSEPVPEPTKEFTWIDKISEEYQTNPSLMNYKDDPEGLNNLTKEYINLKKLLGGDKIPMPKSDEDEEGYNTVYDKLGRPKDGDGYNTDFTKREDYPEGFQANNDVFDSLRPVFHKAGLNQQQVEALGNAYLENNIQQHKQAMESFKEARQNEVNDLKKEWGQKFDSNKELTGRFWQNMLKEVGATQEEAQNLSTALGTNKTLIKMMHKMSEMTGEDTKLIGKGNSGLTKTPREAKMEINKILGDMKDPKHPLMDKMHPQHADMVDKWGKLHEQAQGGE